MNVNVDIRLLKLDFIAEMGSLISSFGAAIVAAASNENVELIELALHQCRAALTEAIDEFQLLASETDGGR